jgi:hypothetical protein
MASLPKLRTLSQGYTRRGIKHSTPPGPPANPLLARYAQAGVQGVSSRVGRVAVR